MSPPRYDGVAPFFSLARAAWIPYVLTWDDTTGEFRRAEGPRGFASYREAVEAGSGAQAVQLELALELPDALKTTR